MIYIIFFQYEDIFKVVTERKRYVNLQGIEKELIIIAKEVLVVLSKIGKIIYNKELPQYF